MINFPNAKINLGLRVIAKRDDGFHDLDTVFYPIPLYDILEVVVNPQHAAPLLTFSYSGRPIPESKGGNICTKAIDLIRSDFKDIPPLLIHLHKVIPMGAGMGGGSADGAFMLMLLNEKFNLSLTAEKLQDYALKLGSDCPFFITNSAAHGTGRGEKLKTVQVELNNKIMVIVSPGIHVSTAAAFSNITVSLNAPSCAEIIEKPIEVWKELLENDFEKNVFNQFPLIGKIKEILYKLGAVYASMTGTGSTVYGIFESEPNLIGVFPANHDVAIIANGKSSIVQQQ